MQGRLLIVHPGQLANTGDYFFTNRQRTAPVKIEASLHRDSVKIKVPTGFKLDELPEPAKIDGPYGTLSASWKVNDGEIVMEQTLETKDTLAPASEYAQVRAFFEKVAGAQAAPVVFIRQ